MKMKIVGLLCLLLAGFMLFGCNTVTTDTTTTTSTVSTTTGTGTATSTVTTSTTSPTVIEDPIVPISGSILTSGGTVDVYLNSLLVSGEPLTISASQFAIYVGMAGIPTSEWGRVDFTLPVVDNRPMDMVFIMDNTGSMSDVCVSVKNSITAFAATLEAAGADVKFGIVSFGDDLSEQSTLDLPSTAEAVATWLNELVGVGGGDLPENPLDSILYAYNNFTWTAGAQKVFVLITDAPCHQKDDGSGFTSNEVSGVVSQILGSATIYVISPTSEGYKGLISNYQIDSLYNGDTRNLADGLGYTFEATADPYIYNAIKNLSPTSNTGGLWTLLPDTGTIDLTTLGVSAAVTQGYTLCFSYTFEAGTWYIHVMVDTNGDGVMDSDVVIPVVIPSGSSVMKATSISSPKAFTKQQLLELQRRK